MDLPVMPPLDVMMAAAADGRDWPTLALTVLAHPISDGLSRPEIENLYRVGEGLAPATPADAITMLVAAHYALLPPPKTSERPQTAAIQSDGDIDA